MSHTSEVPGVTTCPECSLEIDPIESEGEPPLQTVTLSCPECPYVHDVGLLWYTTTNYDVVGKIEGDVPSEIECDRCDGDATHAVMSVQRGVATGYCNGCLPAHNRRALAE